MWQKTLWYSVVDTKTKLVADVALEYTKSLQL
jgi:hypothetical protein